MSDTRVAARPYIIGATGTLFMVPAGVAGVTFDPTKLNGTKTLSPDKLTATCNSNDFVDQRVISTTVFLTGDNHLLYYESFYTVAFSIPGFAGIGFWFDEGAAPGSYVSGDGSYFNFGGSPASTQNITYSVGDVIGCAANFLAQKSWFKNITTGSGWNNASTATEDPGTNLGGMAWGTSSGLSLYAGTECLISGDICTGTFNAPFAIGTLPSGFSGWGAP